MSISQLEARLQELEQHALLLEPDASHRFPMQQAVERYAQHFLEALPEAPAFVPRSETHDSLAPFAIPELPKPIAETLQVLQHQVDTPGINSASGGHLGYIPGGGLYYAGLGDYLAAVANKYAGIFYSAPGAVKMENLLLRWMAETIGFPAEAAGNLTSGGSIASLIALATARDAKQITSRLVPEAVVYLTSHTHHCLNKALRIAGLGECPTRLVPMDDRYRMQPQALRAVIEQDKAAGLTPWLLVASAGTTDVGAVDPLPELAAVAQQHQLWFHVDAAYGGFFALAPSGKEILRGIEQADSVVMDPHKGLFIPYGLAPYLSKTGSSWPKPTTTRPITCKMPWQQTRNTPPQTFHRS